MIATYKKSSKNMWSAIEKQNKTKVESVQLGKTLGLTKVPIADSEESTQVRNKT